MAVVQRRRRAPPVALAEPRQQAPLAWKDLFQVEDFILVAWILVPDRVLETWFGAAWLQAPLAGLSVLVWLAFVPYLIVFFTRGPGDLDNDEAIFRRIFLVGPLFPLLSLFVVLVNGIKGLLLRQRAKRLGLPAPETLTGWPGPAMAEPLRRILVLPAQLVGEHLFTRGIGPELDLLVGPEPLLSRPFFLFLALATILVAYGLLVVGPRVIAGAALSIPAWMLRFALYLVAFFVSNGGWPAGWT